MQRPFLLPTAAESERYAGVTYHLDGELVPVLTVEMTPGSTVFFEHHTLLWKNTDVQIGVKAMSGAFKRMIAGMQIFMTEASGIGQIAFSRDGAGHIFPMHLARGTELHVREHQFLAATGGIDYTFQMVQGVANILFGGNSFFIDKFHADTGDGIVWLHGYGNVFEITLGANDSIDVEPGAWLYKDPSVTMSTNLTRLATGLFAGSSFTMNRFTGPGRLGIQSMSLPPMATAPENARGSGGGIGAVTLASLAMGLFAGKE